MVATLRSWMFEYKGLSSKAEPLAIRLIQRTVGSKLLQPDKALVKKERRDVVAKRKWRGGVEGRPKA